MNGIRDFLRDEAEARGLGATHFEVEGRTAHHQPVESIDEARNPLDLRLGARRSRFEPPEVR